MKLQKDLREFIELLNSVKAKYVIVGGYAVAYHGHPRYTGDIDIFVEPSVGNARLLQEALAEFGFADVGLTADDFVKPDAVVQLGVPPNRIDIVTGLTGVSFDEAWSTRVAGNADGTPVFFIAKDLLIENKRRTGRAKDLADIEAIDESGD